MRDQKPWSQRIDEIRALAGTIPTDAIVEQLGISRANLTYLCSLHEISLRVKKAPRTSAPKPAKTKVKPCLDLQDLERIRPLLESTPVAEVAAQLQVTVPQLYKFAKKHGLKARRKIKGTTPRATPRSEPGAVTTDQLETASRILRNAGYTVLLPCPFRQLVDNPQSREGSLPRD